VLLGPTLLYGYREQVTTAGCDRLVFWEHCDFPYPREIRFLARICSSSRTGSSPYDQIAVLKYVA
jgi:hypothetical protein